MEMFEICQQYRKLHVPAVCDILDSLGCWNQIMIKDIRPLRLDQVIAGPAFTMLGVKSRETDKTKRLAVQALDVMPPLAVAAMSTGGDESTGHWGELMTNVAIYRGVTGAVLDGGIRDTNAILKLGFPIFHKFFAPGDALGRFNVVDYQTPTVVGGVKVHPGDFIFGDCDGVVVVPKDMIEEVLVKAADVVETEKEIRARLLNGEKMAQLYLQYEQF